MNATVEVTLPSEREIQVKRTFKGSAQCIFDFHTKPELLKQWCIGPYDDSEMIVCDVDLRVGGRYRYVWRGSQHPEFGVTGTYLEVEAPHRLVQVESMDGMPGDMHCIWTLEELGDGRTTLTMLMDLKTQAIRDMVLETGMTDGMAASYDRLERVALN